MFGDRGRVHGGEPSPGVRARTAHTRHANGWWPSKGEKLTFPERTCRVFPAAADTRGTLPCAHCKRRDSIFVYKPFPFAARTVRRRTWERAKTEIRSSLFLIILTDNDDDNDYCAASPPSPSTGQLAVFTRCPTGRIVVIDDDKRGRARARVCVYGRPTVCTGAPDVLSKRESITMIMSCARLRARYCRRSDRCVYFFGCLVDDERSSCIRAVPVHIAHYSRPDTRASCGPEIRRWRRTNWLRNGYCSFTLPPPLLLSSSSTAGGGAARTGGGGTVSDYVPRCGRFQGKAFALVWRDIREKIVFIFLFIVWHSFVSSFGSRRRRAQDDTAAPHPVNVPPTGYFFSLCFYLFLYIKLYSIYFFAHLKTRRLHKKITAVGRRSAYGNRKSLTVFAIDRRGNTTLRARASSRTRRTSTVAVPLLRGSAKNINV